MARSVFDPMADGVVAMVPLGLAWGVQGVDLGDAVLEGLLHGEAGLRSWWRRGRRRRRRRCGPSGRRSSPSTTGRKRMSRASWIKSPPRSGFGRLLPRPRLRPKSRPCGGSSLPLRGGSIRLSRRLGRQYPNWLRPSLPLAAVSGGGPAGAEACLSSTGRRAKPEARRRRTRSSRCRGCRRR